MNEFREDAVVCIYYLIDLLLNSNIFLESCPAN